MVKDVAICTNLLLRTSLHIRPNPMLPNHLKRLTQTRKLPCSPSIPLLRHCMQSPGDLLRVTSTCLTLTEKLHSQQHPSLPVDEARLHYGHLPAAPQRLSRKPKLTYSIPSRLLPISDWGFKDSTTPYLPYLPYRHHMLCLHPYSRREYCRQCNSCQCNGTRQPPIWGPQKCLTMPCRLRIIQVDGKVQTFKHGCLS